MEQRQQETRHTSIIESKGAPRKFQREGSAKESRQKWLILLLEKRCHVSFSSTFDQS